MNFKIAMFPGTFDPPTFGHLDIIKRASEMYDCLHVVIAENINKRPLFDAQERLSIMQDLLQDISNVKVSVWSGAIVDYAKKNNIGVVVRGIRAVNDFEYEFELAMVYREMLPELEVLFMPTDPRLSMVRSSMIKEMAIFGADISAFVPEEVIREVNKKIKP